MEKILENLKNKKTTELTYEDFKILKKYWIINGCGGSTRGFLQKIILKILTPVFFEASCDLHDFGYWKGGDETRRAECDRKFYEAMLRDIEKVRSAESGFFKKFFISFYFVLASLYYFAVRLGGKKYFNYK